MVDSYNDLSLSTNDEDYLYINKRKIKTLAEKKENLQLSVWFTKPSCQDSKDSKMR